jgi:hypothetical protein
MAAEQASLAARYRAEATKPENRKLRRLAIQQAKDAEASSALFVRCAGATSIHELKGLMLRAQRLQKRIAATVNRILAGVM